jgi:hypothetical protein
MKRLIVGLVAVALMWPGMSWAQPAGKSKSGEMARGLVTPILSAIYFPIKFGTGVAGAALGGVSGFLTGGNERAAEGIWRPMTGGTYFITPQVLDGERPFLPFNYGESAPPPAGPVSSGSTYMQP